MSLNAKNIKYEGGSKFPRPPALDSGTYPSRLVQILSLGLHKQRPFKGEDKPPANELYVTYEILDEFMLDEDGNEDESKPRWISETFPLHSLESDLAKSTKRYYALDPKESFEGDWSQMAGVPCMITIVQNPSKKDDSVIYNNIVSVSGMRDKDAKKAEELKNDPKVFDIDNPDMSVFKSLPKWLQEKMQENLNYGGSALEKAVESLGDSDEDEPKKKDKSKKKESKAKKEDTDEDVDW